MLNIDDEEVIGLFRFEIYIEKEEKLDFESEIKECKE